MSSPNIIIYTDGSSRGNPGPGGYGIVMQEYDTGYKKEFSQGYRKTTNNRMELLAVIIALEKIKIKNSNVTIFTDSKYVSDAVEKGWVFDWEKKNFKNKKTSNNTITNDKRSSNFDQKRIDSILDKISDSGYDSLSKADKEYLFKVGKNKNK